MADESVEFRDCDGVLVEVGDYLESPANTSDPVTSRVAYLFVNWTDGVKKALLELGNYGGRGGVVVRLQDSKMVRKGSRPQLTRG